MRHLVAKSDNTENTALLLALLFLCKAAELLQGKFWQMRQFQSKTPYINPTKHKYSCDLAGVRVS